MLQPVVMMGLNCRKSKRCFGNLLVKDLPETMSDPMQRNGIEGEFPLDTIAEAHSLGLTNLHIPEEYGGEGWEFWKKPLFQKKCLGETQDSELPSIPMANRRSDGYGRYRGTEA